MNTQAILITLFGVNIVSLTYDQIEGFLIGILGIAADWAHAQGYLTTAQEATALAMLGVWIHQFLRNDTTGLVTKGVALIGKLLGKFKHLTPPPGGTTSLLFLALLPSCLLFHGCASLNNAAASVPASTVQNAAKFVQREAQDAATAYLAHHPHAQDDFTIAEHSINTFLAAGNTDPTALRAAILADIPAADQVEFAPVVDAAVGAYSLYAADWVQKETSGAFASDVKVLFNAINNGLTAATTSNN